MDKCHGNNRVAYAQASTKQEELRRLKIKLNQRETFLFSDIDRHVGSSIGAKLPIRRM
jgi:hypothetical protein